jgi:hypothetical protein
MSSIANTYAKGLNRQTQYYFAQWLPNSPLELGVVGELQDGYFFRPVSTLGDLGINFSPEKDVVADNDSSPMDLVSSKSVTITTKLNGEVSAKLPNVPQGKAGIALEFSSEGAFALKARETYESRIRHLPILEPLILDAYEKKRWKKNYAVVFSLVKAPYADIFVSEKAKSKIELEAEGSGTAGKVELGNANVQFSIKSESGAVLSILGAKNVNPIFQLVGIKDPVFGKPSVGIMKTVKQN